MGGSASSSLGLGRALPLVGLGARQEHPGLEPRVRGGLPVVSACDGPPRPPSGVEGAEEVRSAPHPAIQLIPAGRRPGDLG